MRWLTLRQAHGTKNDQMPDLMRDRIEMQGKRVCLAAGIILTQLEEAIARLGVVPFHPGHDLKAFVGRREEPGNLPAEIALADVENAPRTCKDMGRYECPAADFEMIKMTIWSGDRWRMVGAYKGWKIRKFIGKLVDDGIDNIHPPVCGPRPNTSRRCRYENRLGLFVARNERRLGENPEARAQAGGILAQLRIPK